jgi:hypothetical protein
MANSGIFRSNAAPNSAIVSGIQIPVDADGGIELGQVKAGTVLEVQTKNNLYTVIPQPSGEMMIWGHPEYCPDPTLIRGLGSAYVTGLFREGYLGPGMRLSFPTGGRRVSTSRIVSIHAKPKH